MIKMRRGFTLVELLVVISIIAILAALATISFTSTQKQTRDTQRKSDLKQYQNALEVYANKNNGLYPMWGNEVSAAGVQFCNGSLALAQCPQDPKYSSDNTYYYHYESDGTLNNGSATATKYILFATLESDPDTYWVVCSTGISGKTTIYPSNSDGNCPSPASPI